MTCLILVMPSVVYTAGAVPLWSVPPGSSRGPFRPPPEHATAATANTAASETAVRSRALIWSDAAPGATRFGPSRHRHVRAPNAALPERSDLLDAQRVLPPGVPVVDLDVERAGLPRAEGRVLVGGGASRDRRERRAGAAFAKASRCELPDVLRAGVPDP